jgi:hypothetical protein
MGEALQPPGSIDLAVKRATKVAGMGCVQLTAVADSGRQRINLPFFPNKTKEGQDQCGAGE